MLRPSLVLLVALAGAPVALAQSGPPASRPAAAIQAGTYDLQITFGGGVLEGTLTIRFIGDSLDAKLLVGDHESPVHPTRRDGARLTLESGPGMQVRYTLTFAGETVTGSFTYDGSEGTVAGRRRRPAGS